MTVADLSRRIRLGEDSTLELKLAGRLPEYSLIDDSELRLVIWAA
jgi:hypothetical protein